MNEPEERLLAYRPGVIIWILAATGSTLAILAVAAWIVVPIWQPALVMELSPLYQPAYRAAQQSKGHSQFLARVELWRDTALMDARQALRQPDPIRASIALDVVRKLKPTDAALILEGGINHPDAEVFQSVCGQLAELKSYSHLPSLILELERRPPNGMGAAMSIARLMADADFPLTAHLRSDSMKERRGMACILVAPLKNTPAAVEFLVSQLGQVVLTMSFSPSFAWDVAANALAENGSDVAIAALIKEIGHEERPRRLNAIWAVRFNPDERLSRALVTCIGEADNDVVSRAVSALVRRRDPTAIDAMDRLLRDSHPLSRLAVPTDPTLVRSELIPMLLHHLDHATFGRQILQSLLESGKLTGTSVDVVLDHLARVPASDFPSLIRLGDRGFSADQRQRLTGIRNELAKQKPD